MSCRTDGVVLTPQDSLLHNLEKMASSQGKVVTSLQQQRQHLKEMEVGSPFFVPKSTECYRDVKLIPYIYPVVVFFSVQ